MFSGYYFYLFSCCLCTVSPSFSLPVCVSFPVVTCCRFQHGPCTGVVLRRSAWSRGAPYGIVALCVACVRVVTTYECELVCPCESLSSRVSVVPLPLRSKHRGTAVSSVIDTAPRGEDGMVASAEEAESSASSFVSASGRGEHPVGERWSRCVGRHP